MLGFILPKLFLWRHSTDRYLCPSRGDTRVYLTGNGRRMCLCHFSVRKGYCIDIRKYPEISGNIRICHANAFSARTGNVAVVFGLITKQQNHPSFAFSHLYFQSFSPCSKPLPVQSRWPRELQPFLSRTKKIRTLMPSPLSFPKCGRSWKSLSTTTLYHGQR